MSVVLPDIGRRRSAPPALVAASSPRGLGAVGEWESGGGGGMVTLTMAVLMVPLAVVPKLMST